MKNEELQQLIDAEGLSDIVTELAKEVLQHRAVIQECHDYFKKRNLGEPAEELLVKCGQHLAGYNSANVQADLPATVDSASRKDVIAG